MRSVAGLGSSNVHVDEILKSFTTTTAFNHSRYHLNAMRGFVLGHEQLGFVSAHSMQ